MSFSAFSSDLAIIITLPSIHLCCRMMAGICAKRCGPLGWSCSVCSKSSWPKSFKLLRLDLIIRFISWRARSSKRHQRKSQRRCKAFHILNLYLLSCLRQRNSQPFKRPALSLSCYGAGSSHRVISSRAKEKQRFEARWRQSWQSRCKAGSIKPNRSGLRITETCGMKRCLLARM